MNLRARRIAPILAGLLAVSGYAAASGPSAGAAPISDLRAQAAALQTEIDENGMRATALAEQYNGARVRFEEASAKIADAEARLEAAQAEADRVSGLVRARAAAIYKSAGVGGSSDDSIATAADLAARSKYGAAAANHDDALLDELARTREALQEQQAELETVRAAADAEQERIGTAQAEVESAEAHQRELLGQVNGEIQQLMAEEQQRREAAARTSVPGRGGRSSGGPDPGPVPAPNAGAAAAVAYARSQLGVPYCYAGTGPGCFDCSGLTMRAWQAGGVSIPHFSGAQYDMFPEVPLDQLQPGDLIFRNNPDQHVGIYIGGGAYIHAPQTGDVVKIAYGGISLAVRPG